MASIVCRTLFALSSRQIIVHGQRSWSVSGLKSGGRSLCQSKILNMSESRDVKVAEDKKHILTDTRDGSHNSGPTDFTPAINPSTFDRFILAWANVYPKMEDVPDRVRTTQLVHARDICRVKMAHWMTGVLVLLIAIQIVHGRSEREARIANYEAESEAEYQEAYRKHNESKQQ